MDKDKVKEKTEQADTQAKDTVHQIRQSKYGKYIPTKVEKMGIEGIMRAMIGARLIYTPSVILAIYAAKPTQYSIMEAIAKFLIKVFYLLVLLDLVVLVGSYLSRMKMSLAVSGIVSAITYLSFIVLCIPGITSPDGTIKRLCFLAIAVFYFLMDAATLYYLGIIMIDKPDEGPLNDEQV